MPSFENPGSDADKVPEAVRGLSLATPGYVSSVQRFTAARKRGGSAKNWLY